MIDAGDLGATALDTVPHPKGVEQRLTAVLHAVAKTDRLDACVALHIA